jgi:hypothetical protein
MGVGVGRWSAPRWGKHLEWGMIALSQLRLYSTIVSTSVYPLGNPFADHVVLTNQEKDMI